MEIFDRLIFRGDVGTRGWEVTSRRRPFLVWWQTLYKHSKDYWFQRRRALESNSSLVSRPYSCLADSPRSNLLCLARSRTLTFGLRLGAKDNLTFASSVSQTLIILSRYFDIINTWIACTCPDPVGQVCSVPNKNCEPGRLHRRHPVIHRLTDELVHSSSPRCVPASSN